MRDAGENKPVALSSLEEAKGTPSQKLNQPFTVQEAKTLLSQLNAAWEIDASHTLITRRFEFKHFGQTMGFVNAVAWIAQQANHHPRIVLDFNKCQVSFTTHALKGLSKNDFICACKVDQLLKDGS